MLLGAVLAGGWPCCLPAAAVLQIAAQSGVLNGPVLAALRAGQPVCVCGAACALGWLLTPRYLAAVCSLCCRLVRKWAPWETRSIFFL